MCIYKHEYICYTYQEMAQYVNNGVNNCIRPTRRRSIMKRVYTCRIYGMGKIILPKKIREKLDWEHMDTLSLRVENDTLILKLSKKNLQRDDALYPVDGFV